MRRIPADRPALATSRAPGGAIAVLLGLALASGACAQPAEPAASAPVADAAAAAERCEAAVAETVRNLRGRAAQEIGFVAARRTLLALGSGETGVRGEGRYRSANGRSTAFGYSCAYDAASGATSGVVVRELKADEAAPPPFQPDLSRISPEACESAVARELQRRHPRVGRIGFDGDTRRLQPGSAEGRVLLEGGGAVERAPGMAARPLRYSCEIDTRTARVLRVTTQD